MVAGGHFGNKEMLEFHAFARNVAKDITGTTSREQKRQVSVSLGGEIFGSGYYTVNKVV